MESPLRMVLLALLSLGADTGYGLGGKLQNSYRHVWSAKLQQIYTELAKLHREGLVHCEEQPILRRHPKKVYRLTARGSLAVRTWQLQASSPPRRRDPLIVKLASTPDDDLDALARQLEHRREQREKEAIHMRQQLAEASRSGETGYRLSLECALASAESEGRWCDRALRELGVPTDEPATSGSVKASMETKDAQ